jgi:2,3-bisphosphoglycerate-dependent phosphoglycerate mutase
MDRLLVLVRHGQSEWNLKNLFTGWKDPGLTEQGVAEAKAAGVSLRKLGLSFDVAFTSVLSRAQKTLTLMLDEIGQPKLETFKDVALNERDYGDLSGLNKDDARKRWGEEQVHIWPRVMSGRRVLVSAHGNSLRALVMVLDHLDTKSILSLEIATGEPLLYRLGEDTLVREKQVLKG